MTLHKRALKRNAIGLPEIGLPLFAWAANKPPVLPNPSSLPVRKFQRLFGYSPERTAVICELAGFKQSEAAHG